MEKEKYAVYVVCNNCLYRSFPKFMMIRLGDQVGSQECPTCANYTLVADKYSGTPTVEDNSERLNELGIKA